MANDTSQSGMWLLLIYSLFVVLGLFGAVGLLFLFEKITPQYSGVVFVLALFVSLIAPWPLAVWATERSQSA